MPPYSPLHGKTFPMKTRLSLSHSRTVDIAIKTHEDLLTHELPDIEAPKELSKARPRLARAISALLHPVVASRLARRYLAMSITTKANTTLRSDEDGLASNSKNTFARLGSHGPGVLLALR